MPYRDMPMRRRTWFKIRMVLLASGFLGGATLPLVSDTPVEAGSDLWLAAAFFLLVLIMMPLGLLFVIAIHAINPFSDERWTAPTHDSNPLPLNNPFLFFHFAAYYLMAVGLGELLIAPWFHWQHVVSALASFLFGTMLLLSIRLCMHVFRHKMADADPPSTSDTGT